MITFSNNILLSSSIRTTYNLAHFKIHTCIPVPTKPLIRTSQEQKQAFERRDRFFDFGGVVESLSPFMTKEEVKVAYQRPEPPTEPLRGMPIRPITGCDTIHVKTPRRVGGNWYSENGATPAHLTDSFSED